MAVKWILEADEMHAETCAFIQAVADLRAQKKSMTAVKWAEARLALPKQTRCTCK